MNRSKFRVLNMSMGNRLQQALDARGRTAASLIKALGFSKGAIYNILNDLTKPDKVRATTVDAICAELSIREDWLLWDKGSMDATISESKAKPTGYLRPITLWDDPSELPDDQFVFLPKLDYYLSAGHGGPDPAAVEQTDKLNPFRSDWAKAQGWSPRTHFTMRCKGDSMEPTIQDNAPVVIDTSSKGKRIQSGKVYAIVIDGEALLKRLDKLPGGVIRVRSDNTAPQYQPYEVPESALEIVGRAVWTPVNL